MNELTESAAPLPNNNGLPAGNDALDKLATEDQRKGVSETALVPSLTIEDAAEALGISEATAKRGGATPAPGSIRKSKRSKGRSQRSGVRPAAERLLAKALF
jgi:hypothetical protein